MCYNDNESMYTSQLKNFVSNDIFYWRNKTFSGLWNALCKSQKVLYELIFLHKKISLWSTKCRHIREVSFPLYHINCCFCILTFLDSHQYLIVAIKSYDLYKNQARVLQNMLLNRTKQPSYTYMSRVVYVLYSIIVET